METQTIPPMTDPLSKYWGQPSAKDILIDETTAIMTEKTFRELKDYSASNPTGVYEGKMWKRCATSDECYMLCWYQAGAPDTCNIQTRTILVLD